MSEDLRLALAKGVLLSGFLFGFALIVFSDWRIALGLFLMIKCSDVITAQWETRRVAINDDAEKPSR